MKRILVSISIIMCLILILNCGKKVFPNGPLDVAYTPTATPVLTVRIFVCDIKNGNEVPAPGINIVLHYPNNSCQSACAITNSNGIVNFTVNTYGVFKVEVLPDTTNGYSNSIFCNMNINNIINYLSVIRKHPNANAFTIATPTSQTYDQNGGKYAYTITYHTQTPCYQSLTLVANFGSNVGVAWSPNQYVQNDGDIVTLTLAIPKYYQNTNNCPGYGCVSFYILALDGANNKTTIGTYNISQNWQFNMTASCLKWDYDYCSTTVNLPCWLGICMSLGFNVYNFNQGNQPMYLQFTKLEYLVNGTWYDQGYFGGLQLDEINTGGNCTSNTTYYNIISCFGDSKEPYIDATTQAVSMIVDGWLTPYQILNFNTITGLAIGRFFSAYQSGTPPVISNARLTVQFTCGDFIYAQVITP